MVTAWQCPWATCEPQVALPLLGNLACWDSKNLQPPALLKTQTRVLTSRITSLGPQTYVTKAIRPHQAGSPPAWNPNGLRQQRPIYLSALPTPSLLGGVKTNSSQRCWDCKIQVSRNRITPTWKLKFIFMATAWHPQVGSPPLGCRTYVPKAIKATPPNQLETAEAHSPVVTAWQCRWASRDPQVALPLLGNPACLGQSKPTASSSAEIAKIQVSRSRITPTWKPKFA